MTSILGAITLRFREFRSAMDNFIASQYSPFFSPIVMGDEAKGYEREFTDEERDAFRNNHHQYEPKLIDISKKLFDGHLPICGYYLGIYLIVASYIYIEPWGEIRRNLWDLYGGRFEYPILAMIVGYRLAHNALLAVLYLTEVTSNKWRLLYLLPLGVIKSIPFAFIPTTLIYFVLYANTTLTSVKNRLYDSFFSARAFASLIKIAAFSPGRLSSNLLRVSQMVKGRTVSAFSVATVPYATLVISVSFFFLFAVFLQMILLIVEALLDSFGWSMPFRGFNLFGYGMAFAVMMYGIAEYNAAIRLHSVLIDYDVIHQAREKGASIQDKLEIEALSRLNYGEDEVTSLNELPTILAPRLGLEDPYCFVGPHLPVDPRERADFYWQDLYEHRLDDPNRLLPEREALARKSIT